MARQFKECDKDVFNIDPHMIGLQQEEPFFSEISRHVRKVIVDDDKCPTAAIALDRSRDDIVMFVNGPWAAKLTSLQIRNTLVHELYHLIFGHLGPRRKTPHTCWNLSTDAAINSLIVQSNTRHCNHAQDVLPPGAVIPGHWPTSPSGRVFTEEEKKTQALAELISKMQIAQASEHYFAIFSNFFAQQKNVGMNGAEYNFDNHDMWDEVPEDMREYVEGKIKSYVEKAIAVADSHSNGWGSVPSEMHENIRRSISRCVNWKSVLRQFIGTLVRGERTTSIKQINRRYPYIHPGIKRGHVAKLLIAMDQSGSVSGEMVQTFFNELNSLTRKVTIDLIEFDCSLDDKSVYTWKKGTMPKLVRKRCGGTDFNAPTELVNNAKNRGRWDGLLIMTDGEAPEPNPSRIKRAWILAKGCKLYFKSDETQISLDAEEPPRGAWR